MESSRNQYGFPVMNNEIIYVSRVFALNQKELVIIPTSSFWFSNQQKSKMSLLIYSLAKKTSVN